MLTELPLFPLGSVLLPYGRMPLQIFEPRYLDLVKDSLRDGIEFGVVWIRRGAEVAQRGSAAPHLGDYGSTAKIVDWDQLSNGLLGVTIEGVQRFDLASIETRANGLIVGQVALREPPPSARMLEVWQPVLEVLQGLEAHPHVRSLNLPVDYNQAWQVAYTLIQLLPFDEALKYELLGIDELDELMQEVDMMLSQVSGEA
ncbi:MAG: LON peptidase substrate-binding domain-containing protein [Gammaproteobacteria bacterium]|nr:LON peptidase substrate-binding domain-containing protein [Gammaproteobacteria bacterium]